MGEPLDGVGQLVRRILLRIISEPSVAWCTVMWRRKLIRLAGCMVYEM